MKRLLLLLIIPTLSYSQITFEDIMSINSEKTFKRVVIENGFEYEDTDDNQNVWYGMNIVKDSVNGSQSSFWSSYYKRNGEFEFQISLRSSFGLDFFGKQIESEDNVYNDIMGKIKKNCNYYDVLNENGSDYVCYSCPQSKYKGKIGFTKIDGFGYIKHIIEKKPITFNDVMSINSEQTFNKVMIDNGYESNFDEGGDTIVGYGYNIYKDSVNRSSEWGVYNKTNDEFYFKYSHINENNEDLVDVLIDDIKKNCVFYDTLKNDEWKYDYVGYDCSESTYKGKIGYVTTDSISIISHFNMKTFEE